MHGSPLQQGNSPLCHVCLFTSRWLSSHRGQKVCFSAELYNLQVSTRHNLSAWTFTQSGVKNLPLQQYFRQLLYFLWVSLNFLCHFSYVLFMVVITKPQICCPVTKITLSLFLDRNTDPAKQATYLCTKPMGNSSFI